MSLGDLYSPSVPFAYASKNGQLIPPNEATVSVFNVELSYGFGVYETIRVTKGTPFFLEQHVQRLAHSADIIGLKHPFAAGQWGEWIRQLVEALPPDTYNLKVLLIGAARKEDVQCFILPVNAVFTERAMQRDGVAVRTVRFERLLPQAKTLNMLQSYLAYRDAAAADCYDALLVDYAGMVREGTRTNLYMVRDGTIVTAPDEYVLSGVMQQVVFRIAADKGIPVERRLFSLQELQQADGAFLSSTSSKALPIRTIDGASFGQIHPLVAQIRDGVADFLDRCEGRLS